MTAKVIPLRPVVRSRTNGSNRSPLREDSLATRKSLDRGGRRLRLVLNVSEALQEVLAEMEGGSDAEKVYEILLALITDKSNGLAASIVATGRELFEVGAGLMAPFHAGKANRRGLMSLDLDERLARLEELGKQAGRIRKKLAKYQANPPEAE